MVDLPSSPLAEVDPEFERMALETGGLTYGLDGTTTREKLLQVLANDICRGHLGLAYRLHVQAASMHGITYGELLALIRFTAPFSGYPAAADALGRLAEVAAELGLKAPAVDPGRTETAEIETIPTGDDWLAGFLSSRTGRSWSEALLSPRERALVALTTDVSRRNLGESFHVHVRLALEAGVGRESIRDAIRFCAELDTVQTAAALDELDKIK